MGSVRCVHGFCAVCARVPCGLCMGSMRCVHRFCSVCARVPSEKFDEGEIFPVCALKQLHLHGCNSLAAPVSAAPTGWRLANVFEQGAKGSREDGVSIRVM